MNGMLGTKGMLVLMALAFGLATGSAIWLGSGALADTPQLAEAKQAQAALAKKKVDAPAQKDVPVAKDAYGDPLPLGAVARLGTVRFGRAGWINGLAFSPDGSRLASSGSDGVRVWESASGKPVGAYSGTADAIKFIDGGKRIAAAGDDLTVWDVDAGKETSRVSLKGAWPHGSAFSPDGKIWAGVLKDGSLNLVDASSGSVIKTLVGHEDQLSPKPNPNPANPPQIAGVAYAPDGKTLASVCYQDRRIIIWDVATGKIRHALAGHDRPNKLTFSPNGRILAVGSNDQVIRLWDPQTGAKLQDLRGLVGDVHALAFAPDGLTLASASSGFAPNVKGDGARAPNATLHLWDVKMGKKRPLPDSHLVASTLAFAPNGATLAAAGFGTWVHMIDVATGKEKFTHAGHDGGIFRVALSPDGKTLASGGRDNAIHIWDLKTSREKARLEGHDSHVSGLAFLSDGREIVSCSYDGTVRVWDWQHGREVRRFAKTGGWHYGFGLTPDGKTLLLPGGELWNVATGKALGKIPNFKGGIQSPPAFSPDGTKIGVPGTGHASVIEVATGKEICRFDGHEPPVPDRFRYGAVVHCMAFATDGRRAASGGAEGLAFIWDAATGKTLRRLQGHETMICAIAFSPDGRMVATASGDNRSYREQTVRLWEVATGKERRRFTGHEAQATSIVFSRDGSAIISGSEDGTALVWDTIGVSKGHAKKAGDEEAWWQALAGADPVAAYDAVCALASRRDVALLAERLHPVPAPDAAKVSRLIADLESPQFTTRQQAERALSVLEELAEPALRKAMTKTESLEARRRIEALLAKLTTNSPAVKTLQGMRAVEVLERIGTPAAKAVLETLARGAPGARQTEEAKASLQRLNARADSSR